MLTFLYKNFYIFASYKSNNYFCTLKTTLKMIQQTLGQEEYRLHIYENISKIIVNRQYIEDNYDFFEQIIFKMFEDYDKSILETISITKQIKMFELFLSTMLKLKPSLELPEDCI